MGEYPNIHSEDRKARRSSPAASGIGVWIYPSISGLQSTLHSDAFRKLGPIQDRGIYACLYCSPVYSYPSAQYREGFNARKPLNSTSQAASGAVRSYRGGKMPIKSQLRFFRFPRSHPHSAKRVENPKSRAHSLLFFMHRLFFRTLAVQSILKGKAQQRSAGEQVFRATPCTKKAAPERAARTF